MSAFNDRASAIRDLEYALDRARDDLVLEIGRVIRNAINDATGDDTGACASFIAEQALKHVIREQDWVIERAWRALLLEFAP